MNEEKYHPESSPPVIPDDVETQDKVRRKLFEETLMPAGIQVYLRMRPLSAQEEALGGLECYQIQNNFGSIIVAPSCVGRKDVAPQKFSFSHIFPPSSGQKEVFDSAILPCLQTFVFGGDGLVFAYGATGSGKSFSMQGSVGDPGIIPQALEALFANIGPRLVPGAKYKPWRHSDVVHLSPEEEQTEFEILERLISRPSPSTENFSLSSVYSEDSLETTVSSSNEGDKKALQPSMLQDSTSLYYSVWISFAELYNETFLDLLEPDRKRTKPRLSQDLNGNIYIKGLREVCVHSAAEACHLLSLGRQSLHFASTALNRNSSRSHCIYSVRMVQLPELENPVTAHVNRMSFCDLAGAERSSKTGNPIRSSRLKEAGNINTSLLVLGRCMEAMRCNHIHKEKRPIPFRESKLTRLFQSFFVGTGGQIVMLAAINPSVTMLDESLFTLKFSALTKQVVPEKMVFKKASAITGSRLTDAWLRSSHRLSSLAVHTTADSLQNKEAGIKEEDEEEEEDKDFIIEELVELIRLLEQEVIQAKKDRLALEWEVRQEVCQEYSQHIAKIKSTAQQRVQAAESLAQEFLQEAQRKRPRPDDSGSEDDEEPEEDNQEDSLQEELAKLRADLNKVVSERDRLQEESTQLQFELSQACDDLTVKQNELEELPKTKEELSQIKAQLQVQIKAQDKLSTRVTELEDLLQRKDNEVKDLNFTLEKAGDIFLEKSEEIENLNKELEQLKSKTSKEAENSLKSVPSLVSNTTQTDFILPQDQNEFSLADLKSIVEDRENQLVSLKDKAKARLDQQLQKGAESSIILHQLEDKENKISELREMNAHQASQILQLLENLKTNEALLSSKCEEIDALKGELYQQEVKFQAQMQILEELKEESAKTNEDLSLEISKVKDSLKSKDHEITKLLSQISEHSETINEKDTQLDALKKELSYFEPLKNRFSQNDKEPHSNIFDSQLGEFIMNDVLSLSGDLPSAFREIRGKALYWEELVQTLKNVKGLNLSFESKVNLEELESCLNDKLNKSEALLADLQEKDAYIKALCAQITALEAQQSNLPEHEIAEKERPQQSPELIEFCSDIKKPKSRWSLPGIRDVAKVSDDYHSILSTQKEEGEKGHAEHEKKDDDIIIFLSKFEKNKQVLEESIKQMKNSFEQQKMKVGACLKGEKECEELISLQNEILKIKEHEAHLMDELHQVQKEINDKGLDVEKLSHHLEALEAFANKFKQHVEEIDVLQQEITSTFHGLEKAICANQLLKEEALRLKETISCKEEKITDLSQKVERLEGELAENLSNNAAKISNMEKDIEDKDRLLSSIKDVLTQKEAKIQELLNQLNEMLAVKSDLSLMDKEMKSEHEAISSLKKEILSLKNNNEFSQNESSFEELLAHIKELEGTKDSLTLKLTEMEHLQNKTHLDHKRLVQDLEIKSAAMKEEEENCKQLTQSMAEFRLANDNLKVEIKELTDLNSQKDIMIEELSKSKTQCLTELSTLKQAKEQSEAKLKSEMLEQGAIIKSMREALDEKGKMLAEFESKCLLLTNEVAKLKEELAQATQELEDLKKELKQLSDLRNELTNKSTALANMKEEYEDQIGLTNELLDKLQQKSYECDELSQKLDQSTIEAEGFKALLSQKESEILSLLEKIHSLKEKVKLLEDKHKSKIEELIISQGKISDENLQLKTELESLQKIFRQYEHEIKQKDLEIHELRETLFTREQSIKLKVETKETAVLATLPDPSIQDERSSDDDVPEETSKTSKIQNKEELNYKKSTSDATCKSKEHEGAMKDTDEKDRSLQDFVLKEKNCQSRQQSKITTRHTTIKKEDQENLGKISSESEENSSDEEKTDPDDNYVPKVEKTRHSRRVAPTQPDGPSQRYRSALKPPGSCVARRTRKKVSSLSTSVQDEQEEQTIRRSLFTQGTRGGKRSRRKLLSEVQQATFSPPKEDIEEKGESPLSSLKRNLRKRKE